MSSLCGILLTLAHQSRQSSSFDTMTKIYIGWIQLLIVVLPVGQTHWDLGIVLEASRLELLNGTG